MTRKVHRPEGVDELREVLGYDSDDARGRTSPTANENRELLVAALTAGSPYDSALLESATESLLHDLAVMEVDGYTANSDPELFADPVDLDELGVGTGRVETPGDPNAGGASGDTGAVTANAGDVAPPVDDQGQIDVDALVDDVGDPQIGSEVIPDAGEE